MRRISEHLLRKSRSLDGLWDFRTDPDRVGISSGWMLNFPEEHAHMHVPACWNNELGLYQYEGAAWYRTRFRLAEAKPVRLIFHGVLGEAVVYVDGEPAVSHYGGFSPFEAVLPHLAAGEHELIVYTDNSHTSQTIPLERVDWFHYGGLHRSVELQELPDVYIERLEIGYRLDYKERQAELELLVSLRSLVEQEQSVPVELRMEGSVLYQGTARVCGLGRQTLRIQQKIGGIRLWNVGDPQLYSLEVRAGADDLAERIGFRHISAANGRVEVNGKALYLKGVNRHEEHPDWGFAFPPKLMGKDLDIIERLGCNSIRGSHYPNSKYFIDLLDERGIAFWSEIPLWQFHSHHMTDPVVRQRALAMIDEMIERDRHNPSILFWSVNNECDTDTPEGREFNELLVKRVRELDPSRLVTFATDRPLRDITLDLYDAIGINSYYGWYGGQVDGFAGFLEEVKQYFKACGVEDKPIFMAEFGGAGIFGDVGWEEDRMFSEDYQSHVLKHALRIFREHPEVAGTYIWQFADIRSDTPRFRDRARGFNNKGIVNEYRKPKLAYRTVQEAYMDEPPASR